MLPQIIEIGKHLLFIEKIQHIVNLPKGFRVIYEGKTVFVPMTPTQKNNFMQTMRLK